MKRWLSFYFLILLVALFFGDFAQAKEKEIPFSIVVPSEFTHEDYIQAFKDLKIPPSEWKSLYASIEDFARENQYQPRESFSLLDEEYDVPVTAAATCKNKWAGYYYCERVYDRNEGDYDFRLVYRASRDGYNYITTIYYYPSSPQSVAILTYYGWNLTHGYGIDGTNFYPWYILGDDGMFLFFWGCCSCAGNSIGIQVTVCK